MNFTAKALTLSCAMGFLTIVISLRQVASAQLLVDTPSAAKTTRPGKLRLNPGTLSFGRVQVGESSATEELELTNIGSGPVTIKTITSSSDQFSLSGACAGELASKGASCEMSVAFAPTADKRAKGTHVGAVLEIVEGSGRVHKVKLSGTAFGTPAPAPLPDPLVHAILVANTGCNNVTSYPIGAAGNAAPTFAQTGLCHPTGIAVDANKNVYLTNTGNNVDSASVTEYAPSSNGDSPPINVIMGPNTGLDLPTGLAVDGVGKIYVANSAGGHGDLDTITVYAAGSTGNASPIATIGGSKTGLNSPAGVAVDGNGKIYVVNRADNTVTVYAAGSTGNIAPSAVINGFDTGLDTPAAIALDANANIYVANLGFVTGFATVTEFAAGSTGDASAIGVVLAGLSAPSGVAVGGGKVYVADLGNGQVKIYTPAGGGNFSLSSTITNNIFNPVSIAVDGSQNIYVGQQQVDLNTTTDDFVVFQAGTNQLLATVAGALTQQDGPAGIALDDSGNIYVANSNDFSIMVYPPGSGAAGIPTSVINASSPTGLAFDGMGNLYVTGGIDENLVSTLESGDFAPIAFLSGNATQLDGPDGIALDANDNIYVANETGDSITVYPPESSGNAAPVAVISGTNTGLGFPSGVALDGNGKIYVTNKASDTVTIYAASSNGNVAPVATIGGSNTGLDTPSAIALDSTGIIYVTNEGGFEGNNASVTVYPAGSTGNASPGLTIAGPATQLSRPQGIAVVP